MLDVTVYFDESTKKRRKKVTTTKKVAVHLSNEEMSEIKEAFDLFDQDGSNCIDIAELKQAMRALGLHASRQAVKALMKKADADGSGAIEFPEFLMLMAEKLHLRNKELELNKAFRMYDDDEGGTIDMFNLKNAASELGMEVTDNDLEVMIKYAESHIEGEVDLEDFMKVMKQGSLY